MACHLNPLLQPYSMLVHIGNGSMERCPVRSCQVNMTNRKKSCVINNLVFSAGQHPGCQERDQQDQGAAGRGEKDCPQHPYPASQGRRKYGKRAGHIAAMLLRTHSYIILLTFRLKFCLYFSYKVPLPGATNEFPKCRVHTRASVEFPIRCTTSPVCRVLALRL